MGFTAKSYYLPVGVVSVVVLAVLVLPGCAESSSTVDPKTKNTPTVVRKTKWTRKISAHIEKLKDEDKSVRALAARRLGNLSQRLMAALKKSGDPRLTDAFDRPPYVDEK